MALHRFGPLARAAFVIVFLFGGVWAWAFPPTYGAEFEFTNLELHQGQGSKLRGHEAGAARRMADHVRQLCASRGCVVEEIRGKFDKDYRVRFSDGWYFVISYDPMVVEVQTKPSTLAELRAQRARMNELIFAGAAAVGLHPHDSKAGHFNVGARSAFGDDGRLFLRYFLDYANHAELAFGIFRKELRKAPPLAALPAASHEALREIIREVEQGRLRGVGEIAAAIDRRVYNVSLAPPGWGSPQHNQALAVNKVAGAFASSPSWSAFFFPFLGTRSTPPTDQPFEIRAMKAQNSADEFIRLAELFESRLEFLRGQPGTLEFSPPELATLTEREAVRRFRGYLAETGVDPAPYRDLLLPSARSDWDALVCGPVFLH